MQSVSCFGYNLGVGLVVSLAMLAGACGGEGAGGPGSEADIPSTQPDVDATDATGQPDLPKSPDGDPGDTTAQPDPGGPDDTALGEDYVPSPGEFLHPCVENADCYSGFCVPTEQGHVCTKTCTGSCPNDWRCTGVTTSGTDIAFLCLPDSSKLCAPCTVDYQCNGGYCLGLPGGASCTRPCSDEQPCPNGYACEERTSDEDGSKTSMQCVPVTGRCDCSVANHGEERPCVVENGFGKCWGAMVCDGQAGWGACDAAEPVAEICDGVDNDCDGLADEGAVAPEEDCSVVNGFGACAGVWTCGGADGWLCNAKEPAEELCNYVDEDCDGVVDQTFRDAESGEYLSYEHCGLCNNSCEGKIPFATETACALVNGKAGCIAVTCAVGYAIPAQTNQACVPVGGGTDCSPCLGDATCEDLPGGQCEALEGGNYCTRACEADEDCVGPLTCQEGRCKPVSLSCSCLPSNAGQTRPCLQANEHGVCYGQETCDPTAPPGWSACTAATPAEEVCDGLDNDCDGLADEGVMHDPPQCEVTNAFGTCTGVYVCGGAAGWTCAVATPGEEVCDYMDNNCDGVADEGFKNASGQYVDDANCGACGISCDGALPNATAACSADSGTPRCEVVECAPGFVQKGPLACLPANLDACLPCATDDNCPGGACITLTDGKYCMNPCQDDSACLDKYSCQEIENGGYCLPKTLSCQCDGTNTNLLRGCEVVYEPTSGPSYGCFGFQQCTATGWGDCALPEEKCNLLDDDCDGLTDEDFMDEAGQFKSDQHCGACGNDCTLLQFPGGGGVCNTLFDPPICSMACSDGCTDVNGLSSDGCECCNPQPTDLPDPLGYDANCDGMDGEKFNGVFVSKEGDDANTGLWGDPKLTIQAGIDAAVAMGKRDVYVATGVYIEAITLAPGVGVYGGYSADYDVRDTVPYESAILAPAPTLTRPGAVNAMGITGGEAGTAVFDGFSVYAYHNKLPGQSSYGVYLLDVDATLRVSHNIVVGGSGGKGARGTDGLAGGDGSAGVTGIDAFDLANEYGVGVVCSDALHRSMGGSGGAGSCGGVETSGGKGGNRICPVSPATKVVVGPTAEAWGAVGANGGGAAGKPGWDVWHQAYSCAAFDTFDTVEGGDGQDGPSGSHGQSGDGCGDADGSVVGGLWAPGVASAGTSGTHGGGGGGGGSGAGAFLHSSCLGDYGGHNFGGTGGGGGSGGCGGTAGTGGTSGGGAFSVFVAWTAPPASVPQLADNVLHGGFGGDGGDGGNAGTGGSGGAGGFGGTGDGGFADSKDLFPAFKGGKGGKGGNGGHAGGGGGGCGGPAMQIYVAGAGDVDLTAWKADNVFGTPGTGGAPGLGGFSLGNPGGSGAMGATTETNF